MTYFLYRMGRFLSLNAPLWLSYAIACFIADMHYTFYVRERNAVIENLKVILNRPSGGMELKGMARQVSRNFAKYLVDFLRFSKMDLDYIRSNISVEGLSNIDEALKRGKGVIMLSAHLGNWELGAHTLGKLGYPMNAVVLTHKDKKVNEFFKNQRNLANCRSIEIGAGLRGCYAALKKNELLALLGDRNFSSKGIVMEFCGRKALMPRGPSALCVRTGAAIVACYMIKKEGDRYGMIFEKPIYPDEGADEDILIEKIMRKCIFSIENNLKRNPSQWYVFKKFWDYSDG